MSTINNEYKLIIEKADVAHLAQQVKEFAQSFSLDEKIVEMALKSAPVVFAQGLSKREIKAIQDKLIDLSKSGLEFRITTRVPKNIPFVNWPMKPHFTAGWTGTNGVAFNWSDLSFVCPSCSETFIFKRLGKPISFHPEAEQSMEISKPISNKQKPYQTKPPEIETQKLNEYNQDDELEPIPLEENTSGSSEDLEVIKDDSSVLDLKSNDLTLESEQADVEKKTSPTKTTKKQFPDVNNQRRSVSESEDLELVDLDEPMELESETKTNKAAVKTTGKGAFEQVNLYEDSKNSQDKEIPSERIRIMGGAPPAPISKLDSNKKKASAPAPEEEELKIDSIEPLEDSEEPIMEGEVITDSESQSQPIKESAQNSGPVMIPTGDDLFNVFIPEVKDNTKREDVAKLISQIKGVPHDDAAKLTRRLMIPIAKNVDKKEAEQILDRFKRLKITGRITRVIKLSDSNS